MKNLNNFKEHINENGLAYGYKTEKFFEHTLTGDEATEENAMEHARGMDWMEVESSKQTIAYLDFVDNVNGVDVWHCYGDGSYYFSDATDKE